MECFVRRLLAIIGIQSILLQLLGEKDFGIFIAACICAKCAIPTGYEYFGEMPVCMLKNAVTGNGHKKCFECLETMARAWPACVWEEYRDDMMVGARKVSFIIYLLKKGYSMNIALYSEIFNGGNERSVLWLLKHVCPYENKSDCKKGSNVTHLPCIEHGDLKLLEEMIHSAIKCSYIRCLNYLLPYMPNRKRGWRNKYIELAVSYGNVACLKLLIGDNTPSHMETYISIAAKHGHLSCVQYLLNNCNTPSIGLTLVTIWNERSRTHNKNFRGFMNQYNRTNNPPDTKKWLEKCKEHKDIVDANLSEWEKFLQANFPTQMETPHASTQ